MASLARVSGATILSLKPSITVPDDTSAVIVARVALAMGLIEYGV